MWMFDSGSPVCKFESCDRRLCGSSQVYIILLESLGLSTNVIKPSSPNQTFNLAKSFFAHLRALAKCPPERRGYHIDVRLQRTSGRYQRKPILRNAPEDPHAVSTLPVRLFSMRRGKPPISCRSISLFAGLQEVPRAAAVVG